MRGGQTSAVLILATVPSLSTQAQDDTQDCNPVASEECDNNPCADIECPETDGQEYACVALACGGDMSSCGSEVRAWGPSGLQKLS